MRIAITPEHILPVKNILDVLDRGYDYVFLRFPGVENAEMRSLLMEIPGIYYKRLFLCDCLELANEFPVAGVHLSSRNSVKPVNFTGLISRSCHTIDEIRKSEEYDLVTLSPIFDSISKKGYKSNFSLSQLSELQSITHPLIIALGGMTPENWPMLKGLNFAGYAQLGGVNW